MIFMISSQRSKAKRSSLGIVTYKIAGVSSGGGIGRGLATLHAGLDGSRPIEAVLAGLVPTRISNSLRLYLNGKTECALEMRRKECLDHRGWKREKKRGTITGERSSGRAKYQSYLWRYWLVHAMYFIHGSFLI